MQKAKMTNQIPFARTLQMYSDLANLVMLGQNVRSNRKPYNYYSAVQCHLHTLGPAILSYIENLWQLKVY